MAGDDGLGPDRFFFFAQNSTPVEIN